jgi:drug/metabolite transporter (DMT)-like permease
VNAGKSKDPHLSLLGYASILVTSVLLGVFPSLSKPIMNTINPVFFTANVSLAPILIFTPLFLNSRRKKKEFSRPVGKRLYGIIAISSTIGGIIGPIAYFAGLKTAPASDASLLANGEMVFTIVLATFFFKEKMNRAGLTAVILVTVGVVVIASNLSFSNSVFNFTETGHLLILFSGLVWGLDNNIITYASERIEVLKFIQIRSVITGPLLFLLAYLLSAFPSASISISEYLYIFLIGILVFGGALYFNFLALREMGAIRSTLIFPIQSIFGLIAAFILLDEPIGYLQILSVGIILVGIYLLTRSGSVRKEASYDLP